MPRKSVIGSKFRYIHADSNPLWEVKRKQGRNYLCEVIPELKPFMVGDKPFYGEWIGEKRLFTLDNILQAIEAEELFASMSNRRNQFYTDLKVGEIVHYHHGFNAWIRCQVVLENNQNTLKPIALVGKWEPHQLPNRYPNGTIRTGHYADKITEGQTMQPDPATLFESDTFIEKQNISDPRYLPEINLTLPPMTSDEQRIADAWKQVEAIQGLRSDDPFVLLSKIKEMV